MVKQMENTKQINVINVWYEIYKHRKPLLGFVRIIKAHSLACKVLEGLSVELIIGIQ